MPNPALFELCKLTGGSYTSIQSFCHLKTQIERLAHSSITEVSVKIEQRLVQCFFNVQAKIKRPQMQQVRGQQGIQPLEKAHRTNLEEPELKIIHKDKWPVPLASTNFIRLGNNSANIIDTGDKSSQK